MSRIVPRPSIPVGAFYTAGVTLFSIWAPLLPELRLEITAPEKKTHPMTRNEQGYWEVTLPVGPGCRYRYQVARGKSFPDPASAFQPEGVHGPSEVVDREFPWTDRGWKGIDLKDLILYEIHTGTFSGIGDFAGIIDGLDGLVRLGINGIELMPVGQFPGSRNWGYDVAYPWAVQNSYGGPRKLKELVDAAHRKGIAILLDVVYNHLGPEGNYLEQFGPYFTDRYHTPWGKAINFDDAWCDGVRNYFLRNALGWLEEFHMDGLRLDAMHAIFDGSAYPIHRQLADGVRDLSARLGMHKILIAETDQNDPRYLDSPKKGGYGMEGQWSDEFHHALHALVTGEKQGYYRDFGKIQDLQKALRNKFVFDGNFSPGRKRYFGAPAGDNCWSRYVVFSQNHDQVGNRLEGDRLTRSLGLEPLKLVAALVLLSPFTPLLFMGEEYGETRPFLFFTDHSDPDLIRSVREGRSKEFGLDPEDSRFRDPQDPASFLQCRLSPRFRGKFRLGLYGFYRYLIHLRKTRKALRGKEDRSFRDGVIIPGEGLLSLIRSHQGDRIFFLFNVTGTDQQISNPWDRRLVASIQSGDPRWGGPGKIRKELTRKGMVRIGPWSVIGFEKP